MNVFWNQIEFLIDIIESAIIIKFLNNIFIKKHKNIIYFFTVLVIAILIFTFNLFMGKTIIYDFVLLILMFIIIFLLIYYIYEAELIKFLIVYIALMLASVAIDGIVVGLSIIIFKNPPSVFIEKNIYRLVGMIISKLILFLLTTYISDKIKNDIYYKIKKKYLVSILSMFIINMAVMFVMIPYYKTLKNVTEKQDIIICFFVMGTALINIISINMFTKIIEDSVNEQKLKLRLQHFRLKNKYTKELNDVVFELKSLRHDMLNHIGTMQGLLRYEEYDRLRNYMQKIGETIVNIDKINVSTNPIIDVLVNRKYAIAKKENIDFEIDINIQEDICIDDIDINIILGNILDNAIEANKKLDIENRKMIFKMYIKKNYLFIECINNINDKIIGKNGIFKTSKKDKRIHGIGLKNVKNIVDKYLGYMSIEIKEKQFCIFISIYNKKNNK